MALVITHPEMGIYLGTCMGMGFWSKLDPVGQPAAVTFDSEGQAMDHMRQWDGGPPNGVAFSAVTPDDGFYASIGACVAAGLEGWSPECAAEAEHDVADRA